MEDALGKLWPEWALMALNSPQSVTKKGSWGGASLLELQFSRIFLWDPSVLEHGGLRLRSQMRRSKTRGFQGEKSIHHHGGTPLFSVCHPTPRSQSQKSYGVYHFPGKTRGNVVQHRGLRP